MPVLDQRSGRGPTALHLAASVGNVHMVRLLLEAGAGAQSKYSRLRTYVLRPAFRSLCMFFFIGP